LNFEFVSVNKKIPIISILMIITIFVVIFSVEPPEKNDNVVFHATLADHNLYTNEGYTDAFTINKGEYSFRFVPNGSSPENLSITLNGENFDFSEDFTIESTSHQTGTSEYFTWEYEGQKIIKIAEIQKISITINPNGETIGSVSVDILEN